MVDDAHFATVAGVEVSTDHLIDGRRVGSHERFAVSSPMDGAVLAEVAAGGPGEVDAAVGAARAAYPAWAAFGPAGRAGRLRALSARMLERLDDLAVVETADTGLLLQATRNGLVQQCAEMVAYYADLVEKIPIEVIEEADATTYISLEPTGVAALIVPWNGPLPIGCMKLAPALAAGDTVVLKPAEWAPLSLSLLADLVGEVDIPPGVLNVVQGIGEVAGAALAAHTDVDRISFTGSTDTGRLVGAAAARNLTPLHLELGGKSACIVFGDADLDVAAQGIALQFFHSTQFCAAATRVLVEESVADALLERVGLFTAALKVGDSREPDTVIGPLITPEHVERVVGFLDRARAEGAEVVFGGAPHPAGDQYLEPTMLTGVSPDMEVWRREVFGPVLVWDTFRDDEEALAKANDTDYGLGGWVYSSSEARARAAADRIATGTVWVNAGQLAKSVEAPFGGTRGSGIGREGGRWGLEFFSEIKTVRVQRDTFSSTSG